MSAPTSWVPSAKVAGGTVAGAVTTIVLWLVDELAHLSPPPAVAAAIGVVVVAGVAYFIPGAKPPKDDEPPLTEDERQAVREAYRQGIEHLRGTTPPEQFPDFNDWFRANKNGG